MRKATSRAPPITSTHSTADRAGDVFRFRRRPAADGAVASWEAIGVWSEEMTASSDEIGGSSPSGGGAGEPSSVDEAIKPAYRRARHPRRREPPPPPRPRPRRRRPDRRSPTGPWW